AILHEAADALGHLHVLLLREVALVAAGLHGVEAGHAAIHLQAHALAIHVLAWAFVRAGEQAAAHHRAGAQRKRFHDLPDHADAAVRDHRHAVLGRGFGRVVHGRALAAPDGHDFLGGADAARAHA